MALSTLGFTLLVWSVIAAVVLLFGYQVLAVTEDLGLR